MRLVSMSRTPIFPLLACLGLGAAVAPGLQAQTLVSPSSEAAVPVEFAPAGGFTEEPSWFIAGYGVAGVFDQHQVGTGGTELRLPRMWRGLRSWVGAGASVRGASSVGAGLAYDVDVGDVWRASTTKVDAGTQAFYPG